ncbi:MAG: dTMP kinase [Spirochaetia bacterium]|nr:dTMP kinase [Spirochaetia bacterium]
MKDIKNDQILKNFIVLEGLDGCGTTTQTKLLYDRMQKEKIPCASTWEPTGGSIGLFIRKILEKKQSVEPFTLALLFSADRNEHIYGRNGIAEQTQTGKKVICDRYLFSSLAYQSMFMDFETVAQLNSFYPLPEYLFYIDLKPEECQKRMANRSSVELFEKLELQKKTYANYQKALEMFRDSEMKTVILDGRLSIQEIHSQIWEILGR